MYRVRVLRKCSGDEFENSVIPHARIVDGDSGPVIIPYKVANGRLITLYGIIIRSLCVVVMVTVCSCHGMITGSLPANYSFARYTCTRLSSYLQLKSSDNRQLNLYFYIHPDVNSPQILYNVQKKICMKYIHIPFIKDEFIVYKEENGWGKKWQIRVR